MGATDAKHWSDSFRLPNGNVAAGVRLFHYEPGGTVDKNGWSDSAKASPVAQPLVGDSNGRLKGYFDGEYRFLIKSSVADGDLTLEDWDPITFWNPTATLRSENQGLSNPSISAAHRGRLFAIKDGNGDITNLRIVKTAGALADVLLGNQPQTALFQYGKGSDIASTSSVTIPTDGNVFNITGTADIDSFSNVDEGTIIFCRFTGAGLNLNHNGTSFIMPWGQDYRTIQNEFIAFYSHGSGNWEFLWSNGPRDRVGRFVISPNATADAGYLLCDGQEVSRADYSGLFGEIGTTFGVGNGTTTFNVPDMRGRLPLGKDDLGGASANRASETEADTIGSAEGDEDGIAAHTHTGTNDSDGAHAHTQLRSDTAGSGTSIPTGTVATDNDAGVAVGSTASAGAHTHAFTSDSTGDATGGNMPPFLTVAYQIRF